MALGCCGVSTIITVLPPFYSQRVCIKDLSCAVFSKVQAGTDVWQINLPRRIHDHLENDDVQLASVIVGTFQVSSCFL
jgi:hypothetical protein